MANRVAALFVETFGVYFDLPNVEPWDKYKDARRYSGPYPIVAHPPCQRWGAFWSGSPTGPPMDLGDDNGCFYSALTDVRRFGGVLEHPAYSHAFDHFGLGAPRLRQGWAKSYDGIGYVCCVSQGNYGHQARKLTWLYTVRTARPELDWSIPKKFYVIGGTSAKNGMLGRGDLPKELRAKTPLPFRDLLIELAVSVYQ